MSQEKDLSFFYLATQNKGKIREFSLTSLAPYFQPLPKFDEEPEETGQTCQENAEIKARYYREALNAPVLSDDSGFFIESLEGYPGVHSAREAKKYGSFEKVFQEIEKKAASGSYAYFLCSLCYCDMTGSTYVFEGKLEGTLSFPAKGSHGFGYDPIFVPSGCEKTLSEIDHTLKAQISHRALAIQKFKEFFLEKKASGLF